MSEQSWTFHTIGRVCSPLTEKFGLPRQPGLVPELKSYLEISPPFNREEAFRELRGFSHIWVLAVFHQALREHWQPTVRPPRLGGNERVGVFASRSPYRPNPIALSLCALDRIEVTATSLRLHVSGCDLVDGTPVLDIKPYLPYAESVPAARGGYSAALPHTLLAVTFSAEAQTQCAQWTHRYPDLDKLIRALLAQDPRPAYQQADVRQEYGMHVYDLNVRFAVHGTAVVVLAIEPV